MKAFALSCICLFLYAYIHAQDTVHVVSKFSRHYIKTIEKKANGVKEQLTKQSQKALQRLQKGQHKVYIALHKIDSNAATAFLQNSQKQYEVVLAKLKDKSAKAAKLSGTYVAGLDSMTGVLKYMDKLPGTDDLPGKEEIAKALNASANLGNTLNQTVAIKRLMQQQKQQLKALAAKYKDLNLSKQLKNINKEIFYYNQRVQQYKQTLNDPEKIEKEVLKLLQKNDGFKNWMQQNGQLAGLYGNLNAPIAPSIAGLQSRQNVQQLIQSRMGSSVQQAQQVLTGRVQQAQGQLNNLRNRLQQLGGSSSDMAMPDFKPNNQKTKKWFDRLEKGWNLQTTQRNARFPSVNEVGITLGYRLSDKKVIGGGMAYRFGLGENIKKFKWTHEGLSLRSYVDLKWKGNLWISGGYEQTYWSRFSSNQFNNIAWQKSALLGLTKKIVLKKDKEMKVQLLYDFLDKTQDGKTFPFKIRTGWNF